MFAYIKIPSSSCSNTSPPFLHIPCRLSLKENTLSRSPPLSETQNEKTFLQMEKDEKAETLINQEQP